MRYEQPDIISSYKKNNLGKTLYDTVLMLKPRKIIEFGALHGYSSICMGMALHEIGEGKIYSFDTWQNINGWAVGSIKECEKNAIDYGVSQYIRYGTKSLYDWEVEPFDMLHIDINNDGFILSQLQKRLPKQSYVLFEGGTPERDQAVWMQNRKPISGSLDYEIIDERFPSLSMML